jgi:FSR family fosmidomycin resistance protein-like MFS transporter
MTSIRLRAAPGSTGIGQPDQRRVLWVTCAVHALHDGFTDTLYLLLPLWQAEFALGYAAVGALRSLYTAVMAGLQLPAAATARRIGNSFVLVAGTMLAAAGYLLAGSSSGFIMLAGALILGGIGSSTQHPIASSLVAHAYNAQGSRTALAIYNFAGDLGKMALPSATGVALLLMPWRSAALVLGMIAMATALAIAFLLKTSRPKADRPTPLPDPGIDQRAPPRDGFALLLAIGIIDSATRMGFLTFLPFVLKAKGAVCPPSAWRLCWCSREAPQANSSAASSGRESACWPPLLRQRASPHSGSPRYCLCRSKRYSHYCRRSVLP